jgi:glycosyltransferase involved in cell wall biosynthesis
MLKNRIFLVIPSYNEEKRIGAVLKAVRSSKLPIILVDDGSTDSTFRIASKTADRVVRHKTNLGKGAALKTGCEAAFTMGADAVILMDSDGQHKVEDLTKFVDAINNGYEVVFGSRNLSYGVPLVRYIGNKIISILISLLFKIYISDILCGYRAITRKAYKKIVWESTGYGVETEAVINVARARLKYCEVPVETVYLDRVKGVTPLDAFGIFIDILKWRFNK